MGWKEYVERIGGREVLNDAFKQFGKDEIFFDKNLEEWRKLYPNMWVAVFKEKIIAANPDFREIQKAILECNIKEPYSEVVHFVALEPKIFILLGSFIKNIYSKIRRA